MAEALIKYMEAITPLSKEELVFMEENIPTEKLEKGDFLIRKGQVADRFHFVVSGSVRLYYEVGLEERTAFFYFENEFVSAYKSYTHQVVTQQNFQCMEPTEVAVIHRTVAFELLERFPKFEFLARVMMERELGICQEIIASFVALSPEERYLNLQENQPDLLQRIPQYYLAAYIGVRPESLSRIRKRLAQ